MGEVSIDNLTFKLHYKWTVTMFIISAVLVTTSQFFGEPIQCETVSECGRQSASPFVCYARRMCSVNSYE